MLPTMQPMTLVRQPEPFDGPDWIFEANLERDCPILWIGV